MGELTDNFNEMLTQIQQRDVILHKINDNLEKRVQERTRELLVAEAAPVVARLRAARPEPEFTISTLAGSMSSRST